ncbi:MAG: DUF2934 domain-containing protein [Devosia sp.]
MSSDTSSISDDAVRRTAFFLWEQDGRPPGRELYYWEKALEQHIRQLAYDRWLPQSEPAGRADSHKHEAENLVRKL